MTDGRVIIRISALPDSALRRALSGTVDAVRRASRETAAAQERGAKDGERAVVSAAKAEARAAVAAAKDEVRAVREVDDAKQKAAKNAIREAERTASAEQREAQKSARAQIAEAERALKQQSKLALRAGEERRRLLLTVGAGIYGGVKGATELVGRGQGLAGVGSLEERLQTAGDFKAQLIRTAGEAKASPEERAKVEANLLEISKRTNISITDLVAGLATAQQRFDKFKEFAGTIGDLAKVAQATGENLDDLVGAVGTASQVFQLDEAGQREFINALIATSERGSINVGDFARNLAGTAGSFQIASGHTGIQGAREFLATAQVLGTSQVGAAETSTMLERFMSEISLPKTQGMLKRIGVDVLGKDGKMRNVGDIGTDLLANKDFQKAGIRQAILPEVRAMRGAEFLMAELKRDPEAFSKLQNIDAGAGAGSVDRRFAELAAQPMFKLRNVGISAQADTVRDADRIVQSITPAVTELSKLQVKFPLLTESMNTLEQTVRWAVGTLVAGRVVQGAAGMGGALLGGGVAEGAAATGAGATVAAGTGVAGGGAGLAGLAGLSGAGVLASGVVGAATFVLTRELSKATGLESLLERAGDGLYSALHYEAPHRDTQGTDPAAAFARLLAPDVSPNMTPASGQALAAQGVPANAELTIKIDGPGSVTRVDSSGFGQIETVSGTGRRDVFPP